ncbi:phage tail protein [Sulfurovum sp. bin170]|uniref:phage tail protein n=1 Tax=Sulfurovum sp. bin170 TaxID=2695268 RepID=UPI0013E07B2E|nr:phage tail protein [Sulfurovum sp. bin170]NEW61367.1 phage tail protein [Sulfurovum sp. bin170]
MADSRAKKILNFRFLVEFNGIVVGGFSEVSGFEQTIETEDYREGGGYFVHKLPKAVVQSTLKLKSGMSVDDELWRWFSRCRDAVLYGQALEKKSIKVTMLDEARGVQTYFVFNNAYPIKWSSTTLSATSNSVAIEELEIAHEGMVRSK